VISVKNIILGAVMWMFVFLIVSPFFFNNQEPVFRIVTYGVQGLIFLFSGIYLFILRNLLNRRREDYYKGIILLVLALSYICYGLQSFYSILDSVSTALDWVLVATIVIGLYMTSGETNR
jgi:hypothetical protein